MIIACIKNHRYMHLQSMASCRTGIDKYIISNLQNQFTRKITVTLLDHWFVAKLRTYHIHTFFQTWNIFEQNPTRQVSCWWSFYVYLDIQNIYLLYFTILHDARIFYVKKNKKSSAEVCLPWAQHAFQINIYPEFHSFVFYDKHEWLI